MKIDRAGAVMAQSFGKRMREIVGGESKPRIALRLVRDAAVVRMSGYSDIFRTRSSIPPLHSGRILQASVAAADGAWRWLHSVVFTLLGLARLAKTTVLLWGR